jgi:hypothetical protein
MDALNTVHGLNVARVKGQDPLPVAVVIPPNFDYRGTFTAAGYFGRLNFEVHLLVSNQISAESVLALWDYVEPVGAKSLMAAIERDRTLGGVVDDCAVMSFRRLDYEEIAGYGAFGGAWTVQVLAAKETS